MLEAKYEGLSDGLLCIKIHNSMAEICLKLSLSSSVWVDF